MIVPENIRGAWIPKDIRTRWKIIASFESSLSLRAVMRMFPNCDINRIEVVRNINDIGDGIGLAETGRFHKNMEEFYEDYLITKVSGLKQ